MKTSRWLTHKQCYGCTYTLLHAQFLFSAHTEIEESLPLVESSIIFIKTGKSASHMNHLNVSCQSSHCSWWESIVWTHTKHIHTCLSPIKAPISSCGQLPQTIDLLLQGETSRCHQRALVCVPDLQLVMGKRLPNRERERVARERNAKIRRTKESFWIHSFVLLWVERQFLVFIVLIGTHAMKQNKCFHV